MAGSSGTINSRLELDGEQEYKKALNDAYRELRVLRSELKAETAEMGKNASEQDKAKTKIKSLQQQIQQQERIVETLRKALEDSRNEYADIQEVQDKWEVKLNKAREALARMRSEMEDSQSALENFGSSMEDVQQGTDGAMTTVVSFNDSMKSIGSLVKGIGENLSGAFNAALDTMKEAVGEMWALMGQAWAAAAQWKDIQAKYGGDITGKDGIQAIFTGANLAGADPGTITGGLEKLIANVHAGNKDTMAALDTLHIEEEQYGSHWEMFVDVMEALSHREDGQELVSQLFGDKKGFGVNLLLDQWKDIRDMYQQDVEETGLELTDPEIDRLDTIERKIGEIQSLWDAIKTNIGAKLSEILNIDALSDDALDVLRTVGQIFSTDSGETRKELTIHLEETLTSFLTTLGEGLGNLGDTFEEIGGTLSESDNPIVALIGNILKMLSGILDWISKHGEEITQLLEIRLREAGIKLATGKNTGEWIETAVETGVDAAIIAKTFLKPGIRAVEAGAAASAASTAASTAATGAGAGSALAGAGTAAVFALPIVLAVGEIVSIIKETAQGQEEMEERLALLTELQEAGYLEDKRFGTYIPEASGILGPDSGLTFFTQLRTGYDTVKAGGEDAWFSGLWGNLTAGTREALSQLFDNWDPLYDSSAAYNDSKANVTLALYEEMIGLVREQRERDAAGITGPLTEDQIAAMNAWWGAYRGNRDDDSYGEGWGDEFEAFAAAFGGEDSELFGAVFDMIDELETKTGGAYAEADLYTVGDIYAWLTSNGIEEKLANLLKTNNKYTGAPETEPKETTVNINTNLYLDGEVIDQHIQQVVTDGFDFHVMD